MKGRTVREFIYKAELWPLVDAWAAETGFSLLQGEATRRLYRKGRWPLMAPAFLEIRYEKGGVTLETWVKADFFLVLSLLTGKASETGVESGGLTASVPRKRAREAVNRLLAKLNQKLIS
jgi:hypothetical protein